jgi:8-oxo-dGTP pyrophosphatase MutT (NUDIX family)
MTTPSGAVERRAARVLLVDGSGRVLLMHCCDPAAPAERWWNTTGGGIDDGESAAEAGAREVHEETGLRVEASALGPVVHRRTTHFSFGGQDYRQAEEYFAVRTEAFESVPTAFSALETAAVLGTRWWSREELRSTTERVYPEELPDLLDRVLG